MGERQVEPNMRVGSGTRSGRCGWDQASRWGLGWFGQEPRQRGESPGLGEGSHTSHPGSWGPPVLKDPTARRAPPPITVSLAHEACWALRLRRASNGPTCIYFNQQAWLRGCGAAGLWGCGAEGLRRAR